MNHASSGSHVGQSATPWRQKSAIGRLVRNAPVRSNDRDVLSYRLSLEGPAERPDCHSIRGLSGAEALTP